MLPEPFNLLISHALNRYINAQLPGTPTIQLLEQLSEKPVLYFRQRLADNIWVISDMHGSNAYQLTMLDSDLEVKSLNDASSNVPILNSKTIMRTYIETLESVSHDKLHFLLEKSQIIDLNIFSIEIYQDFEILNCENMINLAKILNFRNLLLMSFTDLNQLSTSQEGILKQMVNDLSFRIYNVAADLLNLILYDSDLASRKG